MLQGFLNTYWCELKVHVVIFPEWKTLKIITSITISHFTVRNLSFLIGARKYILVTVKSYNDVTKSSSQIHV